MTDFDRFAHRGDLGDAALTHDPLENPRPAWRLHYDPAMPAAKWGRFLMRLFRLRTSGERYLDDLRQGKGPAKAAQQHRLKSAGRVVIEPKRKWE